MANKKNQPQRRSLSDRIDAAIADNENTKIAGISEIEQTEEQGRGEPVQSIQPVVETDQDEKTFPTKKATTIMPKEVFVALQRYCTDTDTPKHRVIYRFIIDGLHATGAITDYDYQRFREMAAQLTTTYDKK